MEGAGVLPIIALLVILGLLFTFGSSGSKYRSISVKVGEVNYLYTGLYPEYAAILKSYCKGTGLSFKETPCKDLQEQTLCGIRVMGICMGSYCLQLGQNSQHNQVLKVDADHCRFFRKALDYGNHFDYSIYQVS